MGMRPETIKTKLLLKLLGKQRRVYSVCNNKGWKCVLTKITITLMIILKINVQCTAIPAISNFILINLHDFDV